MTANVVQMPVPERKLCPACEKGYATSSYSYEEFDYGEGKKAVRLRAYLPVWKCQECGFEFTDHVGEEIRHETVCRHLGVLTPKEILEIRNRLQLTVERFSELTGFGVASIKRWENAHYIQNKSADRFLRLINFSDNFDRLTKLADVESSRNESIEYDEASELKKKFQSEFDDETMQRRDVFKLRRVM